MAVEAERHEHGQEEHVYGFAGFERHLLLRKTKCTVLVRYQGRTRVCVVTYILVTTRGSYMCSYGDILTLRGTNALLTPVGPHNIYYICASFPGHAPTKNTATQAGRSLSLRTIL